jgi:hypothetical protein
MSNKVKLTEADLNRIVKKVMNEVGRPPRSIARTANVPGPAGQGNKRISNLAAIMKSIQTKQVSQQQQVIVNPSSKLNGMLWKDYVTQFGITPQEIAAAQTLNAKGGVSPTPVRPTQSGQPTQAAVRPQPQGGRAVTSTGTTPVKPQP